MTPETLICAEGIAPERLSALRDEALPASEMAKLRAHVGGCPACSARLADFETIATALRGQRELEPGDRILNGVRERLATTSGQRSTLRLPHWRTLATLAPVAAIILLFVFVFSGLGSRLRQTPVSTPTARAVSATPTTSSGKLPSFTPSFTANQAWGARTPAASYQSPTAAGTQFSLEALSPDGATLAGTEMSGGSGGDQNVYLITYDVASHTVKRLGPQWSGYGGSAWGGAYDMDNRYIIYQYNSTPGAAGGLSHMLLLAYDRQTGASWQIAPSSTYQSAESDFLSAGHVAFETADGQIWVADLSTHTVQQATPETAATDTLRLYGFSWPSVIYTGETTSTQGTPTATMLRVHNMQTNTTTIMPTPVDQLLAQYAPGGQSMVNWGSVSGNTLYVVATTVVNGVQSTNGSNVVNYETLISMSLAPQPSTTQPTLLARFELPTVGGTGRQSSNSRLITMYNGFVWDLQEHKLVRLGQTLAPDEWVSGQYLVEQDAPPQNQPYTGTPLALTSQGSIYDTSKLPNQ